MRADQLLFASREIYLRRHAIGLNGKPGLDVIVDLGEKRLCRLLFVVGHIDFALGIQYRLVRADDLEHDLLIGSRRGR